MSPISCWHRILERLGAEVRVFNPAGLPMKDGTSEKHPKVCVSTLIVNPNKQIYVCSSKPCLIHMLDPLRGRRGLDVSHPFLGRFQAHTLVASL